MPVQPSNQDKTVSHNKNSIQPFYTSAFPNGDLPVDTSNLTIAFSDLTSAPASGLGDGLGEGAIVTIWGWGFGSSQGTSKVYFTDFNGTKREAAHIYYWKKADGTLPSGPADLYQSHRMYEIAFSIPSGSVDGLGGISVEVGGQESAQLPFTIRAGNIYFTSNSGDDTNDGSWNTPKRNINGDIRGGTYRPDALGNGNLLAGDIVYSVGADEVATSGGGVQSAMYIRSCAGTESSPIMFAAYPNTRPTMVSENRGMQGYLSSALQISKFDISVGHVDTVSAPDPGPTTESDEHVRTTEHGRVVGNRMRSRDGYTFTGWSGAVVSSGTGFNCTVLGNHFDHLGADNSSRFQHTIYMTVRDEATVTEAPAIRFNHFDNNNVLFGVHCYDETYTGDIGTVTGTLDITHNVIKGQRGAGINIGNRDLFGTVNVGWSCDINIQFNVLMNCGLGVPAEDGVANAEAMRFVGELNPTNFTLKNNIIYLWGDDDSRAVSPTSGINIDLTYTPTIEIENNVIFSDYNNDWISITNTYTTSNNCLWSLDSTAQSARPVWTAPIDSNPEYSIINNRLEIQGSSSLKGSGLATDYAFDVFGRPITNTCGGIA